MNAGALLSSISFPLLSTKLAPTIKLLVVMQIIDLLKFALGKDPKCLAARSDGSYPMGLAQLNAMRLADILSDDSNFRSYITIHFVSYNHYSVPVYFWHYLAIFYFSLFFCYPCFALVF